MFTLLANSLCNPICPCWVVFIQNCSWLHQLLSTVFCVQSVSEIFIGTYGILMVCILSARMCSVMAKLTTRDQTHQGVEWSRIADEQVKARESMQSSRDCCTISIGRSISTSNWELTVVAPLFQRWSQDHRKCGPEKAASSSFLGETAGTELFLSLPCLRFVFGTGTVDRVIVSIASKKSRFFQRLLPPP